MGLFRALIIVVVGMFTLSVLDNSNNFNKIPIAKNIVNQKVKQHKCIILLIVIALVEFIL